MTSITTSSPSRSALGGSKCVVQFNGFSGLVNVIMTVFESVWKLSCVIGLKLLSNMVDIATTAQASRITRSRVLDSMSSSGTHSCMHPGKFC